MTYPPPGGTPDPNQPQQPPYQPPQYPPSDYQPSEYQPPLHQPTDPTAAPAGPLPSYPPTSGTPAHPPVSGTPSYPPVSGQPSYPPSYGAPSAPPYTQDPYAAQQQYGAQPPYGTGYGAPPRTNPLAIVSLVCSLAGIFTCISAPVGIILGHIAKRQIRETGEEGGSLATAGLWVGYIITGLGLLVAAFSIVVFVGGVMTSGTTY